MRRKVWLAAALAAAIVLCGFGAWPNIAGLGPRRAAAEYLCALARGDAAGAKDVSLGGAANAAAGLKDSGVQAAQVVSARTFLSALGRDWALVEAEAELVLSDGTADVGWYSLELTKTDDGWKVIDFRLAPPRLAGVGLPGWGKGTEEAASVFREYLSLLGQGKYMEAASLCVGPARAAQERQTPIVGKAPLFKEVGEASVRPLWRRGKYLALLAEYQADGRPVKVVALMCRTGEGWRIAGVSQV